MRAKRVRSLPNPEQYAGQIFNGIQVLSICPRGDSDLEQNCTCKCHCGKTFAAPLWRIVSQVQKSCGTCGNGTAVRSIKIRNDLSGKVFGQLTVLHIAGRNNSNRITYLCRCSCGNETVVASNNLTSGNTKSCGRCNYARQTVADSQRIYATPEEAHLADCVYSDMKRRCYDPNFPEFANYGAKGITMCEEWRLSPKAYVDWCMANGWQPGLSVDRIDNTKGYSPDNCRIADNMMQANNKTNNRLITVGDMTNTLAEWSRVTGIPYGNLQNKPDSRVIEIIKQAMNIQ